MVDSPNFINKFCKGRVMCNLINSKIVSYHTMFQLYIIIRVDLVRNAKLKADKDGHRRLISTKVKIVD